MPDGSSIFKDFSRWLREATKPAALWDSLKTAVWVVPLTVMIWIYAEQQQSVDVPNESILVDISTGSPNRIVTKTHPSDDIPTATLSGSKSNLDQVITKLNEPGDKRWVHIVLPSNLEPGVHDVNIGDEVARADIFTSAGIKVTNVTPPRIQVIIDELQSQDVTITASANPNLVDTPIFDPPKVKITAPKAAFEEASKSGSLAFVQIPTAGDLAVPGSHADVPLQLFTPLKGDNVTLSTPTVKATFTVKQSNVPYTDPSMPIYLSFSPNVHPNEWKVDAPPFLTNVEMTGPPDQIQRIKNSEVIPYAELIINSEDENASSKQATLKYEMLDTGVLPVDTSRKITFSVQRISLAQ